MKSKIYIPCTLLVLTIFIVNIILINNNKYLTLNSYINLETFIAEYDYDKLKSYIKEEYVINEGAIEINRNAKYERRLITYAKEVTEKLFDNNLSPDNMMQKYFIREPFKIFGNLEYSYNLQNQEYSKKYDYFYKLKSKIISENISYASIGNIKLYYSYPDYYIAQVYLNDVKDLGNIILQYRIIKEDSSNMLKVSDLLYFDKSYLDKCYNNNSNIKRFNIGNNENEYISDEKVLDVYNKYKDNLARINVYKDGKIIDSATGIFLEDNILMTTFDIFDKGIFEQYEYEIINSNNETSSYKSIISFSGYYNIAIIKLDRRIGKKLEILYTTYGIKGESVIVPSITGNVYVGELNDISSGYQSILNSNLLLESVDKGSPIINSNGILLGINTRINANSNVLTSVNIMNVSNIYNSVKDTYDGNISSFKLDINTIKNR